MSEEQTQEEPSQEETQEETKEETQEETQEENKGFGDREMHKATCSECGKECEVPFKPSDDRPVYCKECYMKRRRRF